MKSRFTSSMFVGVALSLATLSTAFADITPQPALHSLAQTLPSNKRATDLGLEDQSKMLKLKVWLKPKQADLLSKLADDVSDPASKSFHQWLNPKSFKEKFLPSSDDVAKVSKFLTDRGLRVDSENKSAFYVSVSGSVKTVQSAFQMEIRKYSDHGKVYHANATDPQLTPEISPLVSMIGGISNRTISPHVIRAVRAVDAADSAVPLEDAELTPKTSTPNPFSGCFSASQTRTFNSADGTTSATYTGAKWGQDQMTRNCSFDPASLQTAYGMNDLFSQGMDGRGQTVVIVDAFGSPSIQVDSAKFTKHFAIAPANLQVYQVGTGVTGPWNADQQDWAMETTMDVEYAHTMAPGATIALVQAQSDSDSDLLAAISYAVENQLGNVISNSWGDYESMVDQATVDQYETVLKAAAVQGISVNFSSGDLGDQVAQLGYSDVSFPASSHMTSVGGTSLALNADGSHKFDLGWGNNYIDLTEGNDSYADGLKGTNAPLTSFSKTGFVYGSGGGTSRSVAKPRYQGGLPGKFRMLPDISYLADPQTGVTLVESFFDAAGNPRTGAYLVGYMGGTSLSCPMFSGMWAIANQASGDALGNAAPLLYGMPSYGIQDVVPLASTTNVMGSITTPTGTTRVSSLELSTPQTAAPFFSTFFFDANTPFQWQVLTFGTDTSLQTTKGWDNVTGLGIPKGDSFIDALTYWQNN